jgi:hypothetical protein
MLFPKPTKVKRGNTVRKITLATKSLVYDRDGWKCILLAKINKFVLWSYQTA